MLLFDLTEQNIDCFLKRTFSSLLFFHVVGSGEQTSYLKVTIPPETRQEKKEKKEDKKGLESVPSDTPLIQIKTLDIR